MPAWIRGLVWISGRDIQRETIQVMLDAGYADGFRLLHPDIKGYTFPTWDPHLRLDYVFVPSSFATGLKACEVVDHPAGVSTASDHLPLLAELELTNN
jgi:endonuclease/exonuclease/phosphatase family metal-dependent hydrolase